MGRYPIGLTLQEIREILALREDGQAPCSHVQDVLDDKLRAVDAQLQALTEFRAELLALRAEATPASCADGCVCGIIEQHQTVHAGEVLQQAVDLLHRAPHRTT